MNSDQKPDQIREPAVQPSPEKEQSKKWPVAVKEVDQWRKETLATIGEYTEHPPETADFLFERTLKDFEQIEESSKLVTTKAQELLKLNLALIGAVVTGMVLKPGEVNNWASLPFLVANFASIFALSLVLLDRGYTTFVSSRKFAEWLLIDKFPLSTAKTNAAVHSQRALQSNKVTNSWLGFCLRVAWGFTYVAILVFVFTVVIKLGS